ncbi:MAG: hypothetical protein EBR01_12010 [Proteobacteria bacterium]|nr:hypothetical protein [Pseudomonadota bacterium]NBY20637.1 hypothetical protein [bacterium]
MDKAEVKVIQGGNQLSLIRDTEEVLKFLEFVGKKSILDEHAIHCRLTACHNLFSVVNEEEDHLEYILSNLDLLINRFRNKSKSVNEATLKVYKSRVKSSLEDYKAWSNDPFAWERKLNDKKAASQVQKRSKKTIKTSKPIEQKSQPVMEEATLTQEPTAVFKAPAAARRVSFPIRADLNVEVVIPEGGLTLKELNRLGMFLYPYCNDVDMPSPVWPGLKH